MAGETVIVEKEVLKEVAVEKVVEKARPAEMAAEAMEMEMSEEQSAQNVDISFQPAKPHHRSKRRHERRI